MRDGPAANLLAFIGSLLLHALLAAVVIFGIDIRRATPVARPPSQVVEAFAVDEQKVMEELKSLQESERARQRRAEELAHQAEEARKLREAEQERLAELEEKRKQEEAETRRLEEERQRITAEREAAEREKQRIEEEKRQAEEARRKAEEEKQKAEEQKRQAEEEQRRLEEERKAAEAKRKAEEEKRKAEEARRQAEEEKRKAEEAERRRREEELRQQLEDEERELREQALSDKYIGQIQAAVARNFLYPELESGLKCEVFIRLAPDGRVVEVRIVESSGNAAFDRQAELAVHKASPLPVPEDPRLFKRLAQIIFEFKPGG